MQDEPINFISFSIQLPIISNPSSTMYLILDLIGESGVEYVHEKIG